MARKSIISSFGELTGDSSEIKSAKRSPSPAARQKQPMQRVGAGVIGATQRSLTDIREERDRLQALVEGGTGYLELDPNLIDSSPIPDRLPDDDDDDDFEAFKSTIESEGQQVPIEVRKHPEFENRYLVVYGNRRLRAARELETTVKAFVVDLNESEAVVAQGIENGNRKDLSWIEKALFAARMEDAGIKARDIRAALTVDDAELAKYRSVCRALTKPVIEKIGRAPKVGRPRWLELSGLVQTDGDRTLLTKTLAAAKVSDARSDDRFKAALQTLKSTGTVKKEVQKLDHEEFGNFGTMTFGAKDVRLSVSKEYAEDFKAFMSETMPELLDQFFRDRGDSKS